MLSIDTICSIVHIIYYYEVDFEDENDVVCMKQTHFRALYPIFVKELPMLFDMVCKPRFNIEKFMLIARNGGIKRTHDEGDDDVCTHPLERRLYNMWKQHMSREDYIA
jgi:hypothetical protein